MNFPAAVVGDYLGVAFPTSIEALLEQGPVFLTRAFHATGSLAPDNAVTRIVHHHENFLGGMGRKLQLQVAYARREPGLHEHLFVKFPRDFADPLRDRYAAVMNPEVRFALLSRRPDFPITVPRCYFADFNADTSSAILITEQVRYGENGIQSCHRKCMDFELDDALPCYEALTRSLARLAGRHKAGLLGEAAQREFPLDPLQVVPPIPCTRGELHAKLNKLIAFAASALQLFPTRLRGEFLERLAVEALYAFDHEALLRAHLCADTDQIALCHWNVNLDNAWFWTDAAGKMQAGLLDWGGVCQMNLGQSFFGMTCAGEFDFVNTHRRHLQQLFVDEYRRNGGPAVSVDDFAELGKIGTLLLGISWLLDGPGIVEAEVPRIHSVRDRHDPVLNDNFMARGTLHILLGFLNDWEDLDIGAAARRVVERATGQARSG